MNTFRPRRGFGALLVILLVTALFPMAAFAAPDPTPTFTPRTANACDEPTFPTFARCFAVRRTDLGGNGGPILSSANGLAPADLQAAYGLTAAAATNGATQTIAIVDAYDNPKAEADLAVYRAMYGLPACTTANGCFRKVNQNGNASPLPTGNVGWGQEIALDLDMASAICPKCKILLVEASSASMLNLATSVKTAARLGATVISNSYGASEFSGETAYESYYNNPGVAVTVSSGDSGYGTSYPAASRYVTAVGGTSLTQATNARGWSETIWSGAGSGCSAYITKPTWQTDSGCTKRMIADVAAVADPATGVAVYDTYCTGSSGCNWLVFGGTSVSAPIIAGVYALAGNAGSIQYGSYAYSHSSSLYDITGGKNGTCPKNKQYFCVGGVGYDGPSGIGTPKGTGGF